MYKELELWNAEMAKTIKKLEEAKAKAKAKDEQRKDDLLSAALIECFEMDK